MVKKLLIILGTILGLCGLGIVFVTFLLSPVSEDSTDIKFKVKNGMSVAAVAKALEDENLIHNAFFFRLYVKATRTESALKSGTYFLKKSMDLSSIHKDLMKGSAEFVKVTIPEGYSTTAIGKILEESKICTAEDFIKAAKNSTLLKDYGIDKKGVEGFMFPDTYFLDDSMGPEDIIEHMVSVFFKRMSELLSPADLEDKQSLYDNIILASIVEREYRVAEEAPLIASVFKNRLKIGMGLQSCATIEYIITEEKGLPHPKALKYEDLKIPSDFNTYLWAGLVPGPICSPGLVAIKAVYEAPKTSYMYFVLKDASAGRHEFTGSLEDHNEAKSLYLKERL